MSIVTGNIHGNSLKEAKMSLGTGGCRTEGSGPFIDPDYPEDAVSQERQRQQAPYPIPSLFFVFKLSVSFKIVRSKLD